MRYIGGKSQLLNNIQEAITEMAPEANTVIDLFSGSGVVANSFKEHGYSVICNDILYFSFVLLRGTTQLNNKPTFYNLK